MLLQIVGSISFKEPETRFFQDQEPSALYFDTEECIRTEEQWEQFQELSDQITRRYPPQTLFQRLYKFCCNPRTPDAVKLCALVPKEGAAPPPILRKESQYPKPLDDSNPTLSPVLIAEISERSELSFYLRQIFNCSVYGQIEIENRQEVEGLGLYYLQLCLQHQDSNCPRDLVEKIEAFLSVV